MFVKDITSSIQAEGFTAGAPATLVRFAGCNLNCSWCDARDARTQDDGAPASAAGVFNAVEELGNAQVCLSGGEPLLQNPAELDALVERLHTGGFTVTVETNGTVLPSRLQRDLVRFWSISPKLPASGNISSRDAVDKLVRFLPRRMQFKFVVDLARLEEDVVYLETLLPSVQVYPVVLTPAEIAGGGEYDGRTAAGVRALYEATRKRFSGHNVRYLPPLRRLAGFR